MQEIQVTDIHHGIWIDRNWLQKAGLGDRLEIEMREKEISIRTAHEICEQQMQPSEKDWNVFRTLGDDAATGCLKNATENRNERDFCEYRCMGCHSRQGRCKS